MSLPYYLVVQMLPLFGELSRADVEYAIQRTNKVCTVPEITRQELLRPFVSPTDINGKSLLPGDTVELLHNGSVVEIGRILSEFNQETQQVEIEIFGIIVRISPYPWLEERIGQLFHGISLNARDLRKVE